MSLSINVRRGVEIADGTPITLDLLRLLALPIITIEGTLSTATIADGSVTAVKLAASAVEEAKVATGAITETKIGNSAVSNAKISPGAVTSDKSTPGAYWYADGAHAGGIYSVPLNPALTSYTKGTLVRFVPSANNSGAVDLNVNSLGAKNLFKAGGQELSAGDLRSGKPAEAIYDGTQFILTTPIGNLDPTPFGTTAGTSSAYTLTFSSTGFPALVALYSGARLRVKFHTACSATPTLAVDGLTAKQIRTAADAAISAEALMVNSWYELFYDSTANSGAGAWIVTAGTFSSGNITMPSAGGLATFSHGLGRPPRMMRLVMVRIATSNDYGFNGGTDWPVVQYDEIDVTSLFMYGAGTWRTPAFQLKASSSTITIGRVTNLSNANPFSCTDLGGAGSDPTTNAFATGGATFTTDYALKVYYE